jgi:DNA-directed RNA polymerase specialized sigma24 family protein
MIILLAKGGSRRLLGEVHDAEDTAQAMFVVLARKPGKAKPALAAWLQGSPKRLHQSAA